MKRKKKTTNSDYYVIDIQYNNGEYVNLNTDKKREYKYIVDGNGKEQIIIHEIAEE